LVAGRARRTAFPASTAVSEGELMPPIRARTLLARLGAQLHRAPATRRRRLVPLLACFALVLGAVQFGAAAQPAFAAASSQACYDNPSAGNCDGATITRDDQVACTTGGPNNNGCY
jgi:hypothetical protein